MHGFNAETVPLFPYLINPLDLARKGVVVVTINYRLGVFGFFSHPELTRESREHGAANFALMDTIAALQWVQKNIAFFGGDPSRVTLFGESAGAGLIANLMISPRAKGLFHRAIGQSSAWNTVTIGRLSTLAAAEQAGVMFASGLKATSLAELRARPAEEILKGGRGAGPVIDGWSISEDPGIVFEKGRQNDVPLLVGSNRDESFDRMEPTAVQFIAESKRRYGALAEAFLKLYPAESDDQARDSAFTEGRDELAWVMRNWARAHTSTGKSKAYVYYFTQQVPASSNAVARFNLAHGTATHTAEIQYVFQNLRGKRIWTDCDFAVSDAMSSYWVNFASTCDPNGNGLPHWPAYDEKTSPGPMLLGEKIQAGGPPDPAQSSFFQAYYDHTLRLN